MICQTSDPAHNFRTLQLSYDSGYLPTRHSKLGRNNIENETQLYRLCNEVLFYIWDPIGVRTSAAARFVNFAHRKEELRKRTEGITKLSLGTHRIIDFNDVLQFPGVYLPTCLK